MFNLKKSIFWLSQFTAATAFTYLTWTDPTLWHASLLGLSVAGLAATFNTLSETERKQEQLRAWLQNVADGEQLEPDWSDSETAVNAETFALIEEIQLQLSEPSEQFCGVTAALQSSSSRLGTAAEGMLERNRELGSELEAIANSSERIRANMSSVAAGLEETKVSIRDISLNTDTSQETVKKAVSISERASNSMQKLSKSSELISEITSLVDSVAEQTHLLALNATIEASRAGENGRGFSVVANEVKALARQTTDAIEGIGEHVSAIQEGIADSNEAIESIAGVLIEMQQMSEAISDAVRMQSEATGEISTSILGVSKQVNEISSGFSTMRNMTAASSETVESFFEEINALSDLSSDTPTPDTVRAPQQSQV